MKSVISYFFVVTVFLCLSVKYASSIECYDCRTALLDGTDDDCRDTYGTNLIRQCPESVCIIVIKTRDKGESFVTRACGLDPNETVLGAEVKNFDHHGQYIDNGMLVSWSTCTTDLCNWDVTHEHRIRRHVEHFFSGIRRHIPDSKTYIDTEMDTGMNTMMNTGMNNPMITGMKTVMNTEMNTGMMRCYQCTTLLDDTDTACKHLLPLPCQMGICVTMGIASSGDNAIVRTCANDPTMLWLASQLPKNKDKTGDRVKRFGIELSWQTCSTDLCNGENMPSAGSFWKARLVLVVSNCFLLLYRK